MSTYDYTQAPAPEANDVDDFTLPDVQTYGKSAAEIEAERGFREIPPGEHELAIVGFLNKPKAESKEVYVNGHRTSLNTYSVVVKFGLASDPGAQVTDYFLLPPDDPNQMPAYFHGASNPEGKAAGFMASKFYHFMERLGYTWPKGGSLPAEARRLGNWKGRRIVATVDAGEPYFDPTTGQQKPGRGQVKLFSYKPAGSPVQGALPMRPASPAPQVQRPAPQGQRPPSQPVPAGLDNI